MLLPVGTSAQSEIFSDDFESGDAGVWSAVLPQDTEAPEITLESPVTSTMMLQPDLEITYRDDLSGVDPETRVVTLDGTDITADCSAEVARATCSTPELMLGTHNVQITLADRSGQCAAENESCERIPDPIPPVLFITEPKNQGFIDETRLVLYHTTETDIVAAYRDDGVGVDLSTFELIVDGVLREDCVIEPAEARCPVSLSADVQHSFSVRIEDREGNLAFDGGIIDVVLDPDAPVVTLLGPVGAAPIYNDEFLPVAFTFSDVGTVVDTTRLGVFVGESEYGRFCRLEPETLNEVRCQILGTFEGPQSLVVRVLDRAGNVGEASLDFVPQIDREGPELSFLAPTDRWILTGQPVDVGVRFADTLAGIAPGSLRTRFDDEDVTDQCAQIATGATCTLPTPALGGHRLSVAIEDQATNFISDRFFFEVVEVLPDFDHPEIAFTAPAEIVAGISMPPITLVYSEVGYGGASRPLDLNTLKVLLDAEDTAATCTTGAETATCTPPDLGEGEHMPTGMEFDDDSILDSCLEVAKHLATCPGSGRHPVGLGAGGCVQRATRSGTDRRSGERGDDRNGRYRQPVGPWLLGRPERARRRARTARGASGSHGARAETGCASSAQLLAWQDWPGSLGSTSRAHQRAQHASTSLGHVSMVYALVVDTCLTKVRQYSHAIAVRASLCLVVGLSMSCAPTKPDPPPHIKCEAIAEVLIAEMYVDFSLSISPTGKKLLFVSGYGAHDMPHLSILNLQTGTVTPAHWSEKARGNLDRQMPMLTRTRWTRESDMPVVPAGATRTYYLLDSLEQKLEWTVVEERASPSVLSAADQFVPCEARDLDSVLEVVCQVQSENLTLQKRKPARVVRHPTVDAASVSSSESWLAYSFTYLDGTSFAAWPLLYIVNLDGDSHKSELAAEPIYGSPQWHPFEDRVYFLSRARADDAATRLASCSIAPPL